MVRVGGGLEPLLNYLERNGARFERLLTSERERLGITLNELVDKLVRGERTKKTQSPSPEERKGRPRAVVKKVQVDLRASKSPQRNTSRSRSLNRSENSFTSDRSEHHFLNKSIQAKVMLKQ